MNRKRFNKQEVRSLCGEIHPDDGIDPADFFRPTRKRNSDQRKTHQLCQQVAETLSLALSSELGENLGDLRVVAVTPAPDASQLLVLLAPAMADARLDRDQVTVELMSASGRLRSEVAAAITRRRAPKLLFELVVELPEREESR